MNVQKITLYHKKIKPYNNPQNTELLLKYFLETYFDYFFKSKDIHYFKIEFNQSEEFEQFLTERYVHLKEVLQIEEPMPVNLFKEIFSKLGQNFSQINQQNCTILCVQFVNVLLSYSYCILRAEFY